MLALPFGNFQLLRELLELRLRLTVTNEVRDHRRHLCGQLGVRLQVVLVLLSIQKAALLFVQMVDDRSRVRGQLLQYWINTINCLLLPGRSGISVPVEFADRFSHFVDMSLDFRDLGSVSLPS